MRDLSLLMLKFYQLLIRVFLLKSMISCPIVNYFLVTHVNLLIPLLFLAVQLFNFSFLYYLYPCFYFIFSLSEDGSRKNRNVATNGFYLNLFEFCLSFLIVEFIIHLYYLRLLQIFHSLYNTCLEE